MATETRSLKLFASWLVLCATIAVDADAQGPRGGGPPPTAREFAPVDLTGYWVSIVTEDWRWRMTIPPKGDSGGVPLNADGRAIAESWDPARDIGGNEECRSYGAVGIMRVPGRLHITWQDDETLKIEADSGTQTRLLSFAAPQGNAGTWQGVSRADWETSRVSTSFRATLALGEAGAADTTSMRVVTTDLRPGYINKNGIPYSENAVLTEHYDLIEPEEGLSYLVVSTTLEDATYLSEPLLTAVHFRKQSDDTGWNPTPCSAG